MKTTDWYRGDQKPARVGVYQRADDYGIVYCYWDTIWFVGFEHEKYAHFWADSASVSMRQDWPWRGVAK